MVNFPTLVWARSGPKGQETSMRFPLSPTHQTPLVNAIKFDASVADIAKRWKLHLIIFGLSSKVGDNNWPIASA